MSSNYATSIETNSTAAAVSVTASHTPTTGAAQLVGFSGTSHDQAFTVTMTIDGSHSVTLHGAADTTQGMTFFGDGPITVNKGTIEVVTSIQAAPNTGQCTANLFYKPAY